MSVNSRWRNANERYGYFSSWHKQWVAIGVFVQGFVPQFAGISLNEQWVEDFKQMVRLQFYSARKLGDEDVPIYGFIRLHGYYLDIRGPNKWVKHSRESEEDPSRWWLNWSSTTSMRPFIYLGAFQLRLSQPNSRRLYFEKNEKLEHLCSVQAFVS